VGYSVAIGYLWVQLYPSSNALTIPDGALYGVSNALTGIPLTADLTFLGSSGGTGAAITFVAGSGISLTQAAGTLTIASTSTPVTLPTGVQYYNGSTLSGINTVTDLTLIGAVSGAPGIVSLVAGTNMSIAQVGGNITFNSTYTYTPPTLPTGVQVYTGTALEGLEPTATLQVIGNDGAGNVAVTTLVAGTNMSISQAGPYITFDSTYTPTLPTGVQVYTGTVLEGLEPTATLEVIGNDGAGNVAVATLVAGTNMSISQVGSNITFNSTYAPTLPTGVQVYTGTTLEGLEPTGALEVIGNDGAGNVAVSTLVAGSNVTITQTGSDYTIASTNTGSTSGIVGVYSPTNVVYATLASDATILTAYVSANPTLAQMQTIASVTITPAYSNSNGVGSQISIYACVPFNCPAASALGAQWALFSSTNTTTALYLPTLTGQGAAPNSYDNASSVLLTYEIPSVQGVPVTFTLAAAYTSANNITVPAASFVMFAAEIVPNTQAIVSSTALSIPSSTITVNTLSINSAVQTLAQSTTIVNQTVTKQYANSLLSFTGCLQLQSTTTGRAYFGITGLYAATTSNLSASYPITLLQNSGKTSATSPTGQTGLLSSQAVFDYVISDAVLGAGTFGIAIGANYQGNSYNVIGSASKVLVNECLPLADGGVIQAFALARGPVINSQPYVNSTSPQYSQGAPLATWSIVTRAAGSKLIFSGTIGCNSTYPEGEASFNFYTSNAPTATPFATQRVTFPVNPTTVYNSTFDPFCIILTSTAAEQPVTVYVTATSLTSSNVTQQLDIVPDFQEVFIGSITSGVNSVTAQAGSYLTATTTNENVVVGTTKATTSQAGLLASAVPTISNTVTRVLNSGSIQTTGVPYFSSFGSNIFINFGGAHVGQTQGTQVGIATYNNLGTFYPAAATGGAQSVYEVLMTISCNITNIGTSVGTATLVGLPLASIVDVLGGTTYWPIVVTAGITQAANTSYWLGYTGSSTVLTFYSKADNTTAYNAMTNTSFFGAIAFKVFKMPFYTSTTPTN
jgi:hypothetical protein